MDRLKERVRTETEIRLQIASARHRRRMAAGRRPRSSSRNFMAGQTTRLSEHFGGMTASIDDLLKDQLPKMVARSRYLASNDSYMRRFLQLSDTSVIGRAGIRLRSTAVDAKGEPDQTDQELLETTFREWCRRENCDVTGKRNFRDIQSAYLRGLFRDGEALARIVPNYRNSSFRFALQVLDPLMLDPRLNQVLANGNKVVLGVEEDGWGRPLAYWLMQSAATAATTILGGKNYLRVPAAEIIHEFLAVDAPIQHRGVPAAVSALLRMEMLGGAEEAELTASRVAASKMGTYKSTGAAEFDGDDEDADGNLIEHAEPGLMMQLPAGVELELFDPKHPNSSFPEFTKLMLRGIAAGLGVNYNFLANDLEGVTYGSLRNAAIEDREYWRVVQDFIRDTLCDRVFRAWLPFAILTQKLPVPQSKESKFLAVNWAGRGFPWIDPAKEQAALSSQILETQTMSRTAALAAQGADFEDTVREIARERRFAESQGVALSDSAGKQAEKEEGEE